MGESGDWRPPTHDGVGVSPSVVAGAERAGEGGQQRGRPSDMGGAGGRRRCRSHSLSLTVAFACAARLCSNQMESEVAHYAVMASRKARCPWSQGDPPMGRMGR